MTRDEFIELLPGLIKDYQAPAMTLAAIKNISLLMIVGATGVGKTVIIKRLGIPFVITDTTRPIRPTEINGSDYFFRTDYKQLIDEVGKRAFIQVAIGPAGDFYGTRVSAYPEVGLAVYAVVADVVPMFRQLGFGETVCAYVTPPSFSDWMGRLDPHNFESDQLAKRLQEAKRSFHFALNDPTTHFILNDDLGLAINQVHELVGGRVDEVRERHARQAAETIAEKLSFV